MPPAFPNTMEGIALSRFVQALAQTNERRAVAAFPAAVDQEGIPKIVFFPDVVPLRSAPWPHGLNRL